MPELTNRTSHRFFGSLQEAYDRLDAIIENSYDGIYITDGQAITLRINRAYEKYGNVRQAAASLGMDASTFVRKRQKYERASGLLQK